MKIINLGGATAIIEHAGKRMLFDPWLDDGIFHGAWHHYPPLKVGIEDLGHLDYIYISHIHEDHCSAGTIKHLNPDAEIIIMDRRPNYVANFLKANNFAFKKVHLIPARTPTKIAPGLVVDMVEADPDNEMACLIDSAIIISWDGTVIYNANDCQPYDDGLKYIKDEYKKVDFAMLPYAGGSGYPSCYVNLTEKQKLSEKGRILSQRVKNFVSTVVKLDPTHAMPFADQYVVVGSRSNLNKFISHPPCGGVVKEEMYKAGLEEKLVLLNSGQEIELDTMKKSPDEPYVEFTDSDREEYANEHYLEGKYDHEKITISSSVAIDRLLECARKRLWQAQARRESFPSYNLYLNISDKSQLFKIPLDNETVESAVADTNLQEPYLKISAESTLMTMLLIGHVSWNIADAALFLDYERLPNDYLPEIYVLLNLLRV